MKSYYGLTKDEVKRSIATHGTNILEGKKRVGFLKRLLSNFNDPIIRVLLIALLVNIVFTLKNLNLIECVGILLAVLVSTLVSTLSEQGSENAFARLQAESGDVKVRVFREGELCEVLTSEIAVGDILLLGMGEAVPADGVLLEGEILVNQAALNGESKEAKKRPSKKQYDRTPDAENLVFRGSLVTRGSCVMRVSEVGSATFLGGVAEELSENTRESPLKIRLAGLAKTVSRIGYLLAAVVAFSYLFDVVLIDNGFDSAKIALFLKDYKTLLSHLIRALTLAITIVVVAVPEGLPMMICVVLSSNMKRMLSDEILVKKMVGIETAGSMNLLFSDKTGTFTTGSQELSSFLFADGRRVSKLTALQNEASFSVLRDTAIYNTECRMLGKNVSGSNATDRAMVSFFKEVSTPVGAIYGGVPFDSRYKYSAAKTAEERVLLKGAPEVLLPHVTKVLARDGKEQNADKEALFTLFREATADASRLVAIAYTDRMPSAVDFPSLTFVAFAVIRDPLRKSTRSSIKALKKAGIGVVMVTGDSPDTAKAIAKESGLWEDDGGVILTSEELSRLSDRELSALLPRLRVVARALPQDKTRLVRVAQEAELVTGMTGDGVNDAPALKLADVGFAMGSGTEIAKEAGDIVILNNDMAAMVKAVLYGRTIFKSIRKFIIFQLTMNFCAVGVTLLGPVFGIVSPITVVQMLWVNMIMDTLGGLAFAGEAPEKHTLEEAPKKRDESLLSRASYFKIIWNGSAALSVSIAFLSLGYFKRALSFDTAPLIFYSAFFSLFIFMGVVTFYIARSDRLNFLAGLLHNTSFLFITLLVTAVQLLMVYFGGEMFRTTPLSPRILLGVAALSVVILPLDLCRRALFCRTRE